MSQPIVTIKLPKLYTGSSYYWGNPYPQVAIPLIDHNIHYAGISIVHDGFDCYGCTNGSAGVITFLARALQIAYRHK